MVHCDLLVEGISIKIILDSFDKTLISIIVHIHLYKQLTKNLGLLKSPIGY